MANCSPCSFTNVTDAAFKCLVAKAAKHSVKIDSDSGKAGASGFKFTWNYERAAQTLTIQCTGRLPLISCKTVNKNINDQVNGCLQA
jgi:hypothetical protein